MRRLLLLVVVLLPTGCRIEARRIEPVTRPVVAADTAQRITSPTRAHLVDGGVVVYAEGVELVGDSLLGAGYRYDLLRRDSVVVSAISLDSVVAMESFRQDVDRGATTALSAPATVVGTTLVVGGAIVLFKAIFGSCPTIYSDSAGVERLESEAFPYSIAPLFEMRDVDRLRASADERGVVDLDVRNEALETHYLNQLALFEVLHGAHELALADERGQPLVAGSLRSADAARAAAGAPLDAVLGHADGAAYVASDERLASASSAEEVFDGIELSFAAPRGDSAAVVFRLRNSLLNTVLLYDFMLAAQGARALDWLGSDLATIGPAVDVGNWYSAHMGIRVSVRDGRAWREVGRVPDAGPIAWKDIALVVPVLERDTLRVRLSFLTDSWRIDRVALGEDVRRPVGRSIPVARVVGADGADDAPARDALRAPDESWLRTMPGESFVARFEAGAVPAGTARTFLLVSQGYYVEWVRADWIRAAAPAPRPFVPDDRVLVELMQRWADRRGEFEASFYDHRVPVR